jgi:Flagellar hook-length control protein FliK
MRVSAALGATADVRTVAAPRSRGGADPAAANGFGALLQLLLQPTSLPRAAVCRDRVPSGITDAPVLAHGARHRPVDGALPDVDDGQGPRRREARVTFAPQPTLGTDLTASHDASVKTRDAGLETGPAVTIAMVPPHAGLVRQPRAHTGAGAFAVTRRHQSIDAPAAGAPAVSLMAWPGPADAHGHPTVRLAAAHGATAPREPQMIERIVRMARVVIRDGVTQLAVRLAPPSLGPIRIVAAEGGGGVILTIAAERPETRALLVQAIQEIEAALASHGIATASITVVATFDPPIGRRALTRREPERQARDRRPLTKRPAAGAGAVTTVDLTV